MPPEYASKFRGKREVLKTHRAWDPGAAVLARALAREFHVGAQHGRFTRLLIDLNRRESSSAAFSEFTPEGARDALLDYHRRWRRGLFTNLAHTTGPILHVSCHSFTPVWNGEERRVDIGLLFDPGRSLESDTAKAWQEDLQVALPGVRIRRNNPYRGVNDGVTSWLRKYFDARRYAGIEIELNQRFAAAPPRVWSGIRRALLDAVGASMMNTP